MNIIENAIDSRILELPTLVLEDNVMDKAIDMLDKYCNELSGFVTNRQAFLNFLDAVCHIRFAECEAGYRIGISDGMQLQQEINGLLKEGGN